MEKNDPVQDSKELRAIQGKEVHNINIKPERAKRRIVSDKNLEKSQIPLNRISMRTDKNQQQDSGPDLSGARLSSLADVATDELDIAKVVASFFKDQNMKTLGQATDGRCFLYGEDLAEHIVEKIKEKVSTLQKILEVQKKNLGQEGAALFVVLDKVRLEIDVAEKLVTGLFAESSGVERFSKNTSVIFVDPDNNTIKNFNLICKDKNTTCMVYNSDLSKITYLGTIEGKLVNILKYISIEKQVSPKMLSSVFNISESDASARLTILLKLGYLHCVSFFTENNKKSRKFSVFLPHKYIEKNKYEMFFLNDPRKYSSRNHPTSE